MHLLETDGNCPHCGKKISGYNVSVQEFGSPIRICKGCGHEYLDRRYHEAAVEGYQKSSLDIRNSCKVILLGCILLAASGLLNLHLAADGGRYSAKGLITSVLSLLILIYGIVDAVRIRTGIKRKGLEKKIAESKARLQNKVYAQQLAELGYDVPAEYL